MSTKELAVETIKGLPDDASWKEIEKRIQFLSGVEQAREEIRRDEFIPHQDVRKQFDGWLGE